VPSSTVPTKGAEGLPDLLRTILGEQKGFLPNGERAPLHSNISIEEAQVLYRAVRALKPAVSAEIGFAQGISALAILKALEDNGQGTHHIMDPFQERYQDLGLAHVERAGLSHRLRFYRQFAEEVAPSLPRLQFAFIDSSHLFDLTIAEFVLIEKKLDVGGVIGFHDMWMASLQAVLRYILANRNFEVVKEFDEPNEAPKTSPVKRLLRGISRKLPKSEKIFRKDFLTPWSEMAIPNLVLVRKLGEENRDWRFHADF
jgi:predicted O-methyltransferase YrrM